MKTFFALCGAILVLATAVHPVSAQVSLPWRSFSELNLQSLQDRVHLYRSFFHKCEDGLVVDRFAVLLQTNEEWRIWITSKMGERRWFATHRSHWQNDKPDSAFAGTMSVGTMHFEGHRSVPIHDGLDPCNILTLQ